MATLGTLNEAPRLVDLPPIPEWFERELSDIQRIDGQPLFKIVDGQREQIWRNGRMEIKHYLQTDEQACFVRIERQYFLRKNFKTGAYQEYSTREEAKADTCPDLFKIIEPRVAVEVRMVGKPCWIIETLVPAKDIPENAWKEMRFQEYFKDGKWQMVDVLGEYPRGGKYIECLALIDDGGEPVAPNRAIIENLKIRVWEFEHDRRSLEQKILDDTNRQRDFEAKQVKQSTDNFYQRHGLAAQSKYHHVAVGKPIIIDKNLPKYEFKEEKL